MSIQTSPPNVPRQYRTLQYIIIIGAAMLAFVIWTIPNWPSFLDTIGQVDQLWQNDINRRSLLILWIKILSPVCIGALINLSFWQWSLLTSALKIQKTEADLSSPMPSLMPPYNPSFKDELVPMETTLPQPHDAQQPNNPQHSVVAIPATQPNTPPQEQTLFLDEQEHLYPTTVSVPHTPTQIDQQENVMATSPSQNEYVKNDRQQEQGDNSPVKQPHNEETASYEIHITLLKKMSVRLIVGHQTHEVPITLNAKRMQLLAYVAWRQGEPVHRERLLEHVFGHGIDDELATTKRLNEAFDSHKKLLRENLRTAIKQLNADAGRELMPLTTDFFALKQRQYRLADCCRVTDLETIQRAYRILETAQKAGQLSVQIPEEVNTACETIIEAYVGDFLGDVLINYINDFDPWTSSWVRTPFTLFRDYYLQALWYAAEYKLQQAQTYKEPFLGEAGEEQRQQQRKFSEVAARYYHTYALYACNSRLDQKVSFTNTTSERVIMSERALRRAILLYGSLGATHQVDQLYSAYNKQMRSISAKNWQPGDKLIEDLRKAKEQTNAHHFPKQLIEREHLISS